MSNSDRSSTKRVHSAYRYAAAAGVNLTMVGPALVLFTLLVIVPVVLTFIYSFTDWNGYSQSMNFIGLDNYRRVFGETQSRRAMFVTAVIAVAGTALINAIAVPTAVLMNHRGRIYNFYRAAILYPYVVSAIIAGFLFNAIVSPDGAINAVLKAFGLQPAPFLLEPNWALGTIVAVIVWGGTGFALVLYLAGLQAIPQELVEAARVDGATPTGVFWNITWPLLQPIVTINVVLSLSGLLRTYDIILSLTNAGPAGQTQTIAYRVLAIGYQNAQIGLSSAGAVVLLVFSATLAVAVVLYRQRKDIT